MDAAERALMKETVVGALAPADANADAVLADLGWLELLEAEPRDAIDIVFTALGATNSAATVLDDVIVAALGLKPRADLGVLLPQFGGWEIPGRIDGTEVRASGITTRPAVTARDLLVVCADGSSVVTVTVPASSAELRAVQGIDPEAGFQIVRVEHGAREPERLDRSAWDAAIAWGRRAVAHQIAGASRAMLDLARAHARERVQFGRPVGRFQAVRHRLADALVAIEALEATLEAAGDEATSLTAALAKATAGRTAHTVATNCQQVLAGIGFTTDHPFHRFLKRTMLLEGIFGSAEAIATEVGRQLLATRRVPTLIEL